MNTGGAVILLSGGLDSVVALAVTHQRQPVALALTIDYGQRARAKEIEAAQAVAGHYGIPHQVIALPWLSELLPQGLSTRGESATTLESVWVPNRNGVFLNIAAATAEALGATTVVFGANAEEAAAGFPDNSETYVQRLNEALALSTLNQVKVTAPCIHWDKDEIVRQGVAMAVPLSLVWSCYGEGPTHCGVCMSCQRLKRALGQSNPSTSVPF